MLPKKGQKRKPLRKNPKVMLMYGPYKVGKTELISRLDDCLIIDTEESTESIEVEAVNVYSWNDVKALYSELVQAYRSEGQYPYRRLAIDTVSQLAEYAKQLATEKFYESNTGKGLIEKHQNDPHNIKLVTPENLLQEAGYGAGYMFLKEALFEIVDYFSSLCETLILIGHMTEKFDEGDVQVTKKSVLLPGGGLRSALLGRVSAVGVFRRDHNKLRISFRAGQGTIGESRFPKVSGRDIVISEKDSKTGEIHTHWEEIFENY